MNLKKEIQEAKETLSEVYVKLVRVLQENSRDGQQEYGNEYTAQIHEVLIGLLKLKSKL